MNKLFEIYSFFCHMFELLLLRSKDFFPQKEYRENIKAQ